MIGLWVAGVLVVVLFVWFIRVNNRDLGDIYKELEAEAEDDEESAPAMIDKKQS
ncbi:MAG: hypothetical protein H7838_08670 [Magnetococcus sp. DMHC-8]